MDRRSFVVGSAAAAAATTLAGGSAAAQGGYPTRPVTFINPFPPGGAVDVVARPLAAVLEPILKQPVVIETKAGAAGQVGAQFAASATPDGHTLLMHIVSISGFAEVDKLFGRPVKFTRENFIPIARFIADPMVLVVNDKQPYKTLGEFVAGPEWSEHVFALPSPLPAGPPVLRLDVPTWRPINVDPASTDTRDLGIMVDRIRVVPGDPGKIAVSAPRGGGR